MINEKDKDKKTKQDIATKAMIILQKEVTSLYLTRAGILEQLNSHKRASTEYNAILSLLFLNMQFGVKSFEESKELKKFVLDGIKRCDAVVREQAATAKPVSASSSSSSKCAIEDCAANECKTEKA